MKLGLQEQCRKCGHFRNFASAPSNSNYLKLLSSLEPHPLEQWFGSSAIELVVFVAEKLKRALTKEKLS
jgi:hypothetical protein